MRGDSPRQRFNLPILIGPSVALSLILPSDDSDWSSSRQALITISGTGRAGGRLGDGGDQITPSPIPSSYRLELD